MSENERALVTTSFEETSQVANAMVRSGFFKDAKNADQALIKIWAGRELGIGAVEAMRGIYIIEGNLTPSAGLTASLVKRSGKYNYRVKVQTDTACEIEFFEGGQSVGVSTWTMDDAKRAGLATKANWTKGPSDMLFARAMTRGCRRFCPDVFGGSIYDQGEFIDAEVSEVTPRAVDVDESTGEIIDTTPVTQQQGRPAPPAPADDSAVSQRRFWARYAELYPALKGEALKHQAYRDFDIESFNDDWLAEGKTWEQALALAEARREAEEQGQPALPIG